MTRRTAVILITVIGLAAIAGLALLLAPDPALVAWPASRTDTASMRQAIRDPGNRAMLDTSNFHQRLGDNRVFQNTTVRGRIWPQKHAAFGDRKNGKVLAAIHVNADYQPLGLRQGWNYWVIGRDRTGWYGVMVPYDSGAAFVHADSLGFRSHGSSWWHKTPVARWIERSPASAWGTCNHSACCCTGDDCLI